MAVKQLAWCAAFAAAIFLFSVTWPPTVSAGDGPNQVTPSDYSAGNLIDSLFEPDLSGQSFQEPASRVSPRRVAQRRTSLRGKLVNNPDTSDGSPSFALVDRYGGVLRYVEPVDEIDLETYIGKTVAVRRDTGDILLASQLAFPRTSKTDGELQLAAFAEPTPADGPEPIPAGEPTDGSEVGEPIFMSDDQGPVYYDEGFEQFYGDGIDFGGCPQCGTRPCRRRDGCSPGARGVVYLRAEYLLWWFDGMRIPPLVVEGEADNGDFVNAVVVYGNEKILDDSRDGFRIRAGVWLDDCGQLAIEGDYFGFDTVSTQFVDGGDGETLPFVGRPFIDATTGLDAVQDVSFPGIQGTVTVDATSEFDSAGLRFRRNICCVAGNCGGCGGCGDAVGCGRGIGCGRGVGCGSGVCGGRVGTRRIDFLLGVRSYNLDESLVITEDLETIEPSPSIPSTEIYGQDRFFTNNEFFGGELGFLWEWECRRWSLELLSLATIGNNQQTVNISGFTERDTNLGIGVETKEGLLLTQNTNIGNYERDEFTVIPQIGATVGFQLTPRLRLTGGYTLVYWGNVVRPGDQIDLEVNPALLDFPPPANPIPARPQFAFNETDFWGHGLSIGGEYRW